MIKGASKPLLVIGVCAATLVGASLYVWHESRRPPVLELYVFDLPGALSILIRTPNDKRILIDGGSNAEIIKHLTDVLPFYSRHIDLLVATKTDGKNVTGLVEVLNRYTVDKVIIPKITLESLGMSSTTDIIYKTFLDTARSSNVSIQELVAGNRMSFDENVAAEALFPAESDKFKYSKARGPEIILRISYDLNSIEFIGDSSTKVQKFIAAEYSRPTDVLITSNSVGTSMISNDLINSTSPDFIVYSQQISKVPKKPLPTSNQNLQTRKKSLASSTVKTKSSTKAKTDQLAGISNNNRFNIRETGGVKITSDGITLKVEKLK